MSPICPTTGLHDSAPQPREIWILLKSSVAVGSVCELMDSHKPGGSEEWVFHEKKHSSGTTLSNTVALSLTGLFKFKLIKMQHNLKFSSSGILAIL